jgi:hypothetical protein
MGSSACFRKMGDCLRLAGSPEFGRTGRCEVAAATGAGVWCAGVARKLRRTAAAIAHPPLVQYRGRQSFVPQRSLDPPGAGLRPHTPQGTAVGLGPEFL